MSLNSNHTHVKEVCKVDEGSERCKYLIIDITGLKCAKDTPEYKKDIDGEWTADSHSAKGDNCIGYAKSETEKRNQNDKRYEEPFEDDGAYCDDFID